MNKEFDRHLWQELDAWRKSSARKPLVLRGARQVGKTTLVRRFGKRFTNFIEFNLEREENRSLVAGSKSAFLLMESISLMHGLPASAWSETLLFIDEIQEVPKAIGYLRYFYEDIPELYVISAGSLLEYGLSRVESIPVGRVNYMYLFPLNFREYLLATGKEVLLERLKIVPIDETAHGVLLKLFHTYGIIGGMPEVVARYIETKSISELLSTYESIWGTYKDDVVKYADSHTERDVLRYIMNSAAALVDKRVKYQNFGASNFRSREVSEAFRSLDQAKVIQIIHPTTQTQPPLLPDIKKSPRMQFLDTGLLNFDLGIQGGMLEMDDLSSAYKGAIIPHLITQEIISLSTGMYKKPHFWVRDKTHSSAEVDLVHVFKGLAIPIEIKSGATGTLKSLHEFMDRTPHQLAVRMYAGEFRIEKSKTRTGKSFHLMNMPYYLGTYLDEYLGYFYKQVHKSR